MKSVSVRGIMARPKRQFALIDFDNLLQWVAVRFDHCASQLLQEQPSTLVAPQTELNLQSQGRAPLQWLVTMCAAMNRERSGKWRPSITVPAVTEVCRRQVAHSQLTRRRRDRQPFRPPQAGQTKPSGQRLSARFRAQASSPGNRASNCMRDIGRSCFHRLAEREHCKNMAVPAILANTISGSTGLKGIRLSNRFIRIAGFSGAGPGCAVGCRGGHHHVRRARGVRTILRARTAGLSRTSANIGFLIRKPTPDPLWGSLRRTPQTFEVT
jgi:hypothetical protein